MVKVDNVETDCYQKLTMLVIVSVHGDHITSICAKEFFRFVTPEKLRVVYILRRENSGRGFRKI